MPFPGPGACGGGTKQLITLNIAPELLAQMDEIPSGRMSRPLRRNSPVTASRSGRVARADYDGKCTSTPREIGPLQRAWT
jgi:hypothetical protein